MDLGPYLIRDTIQGNARLMQKTNAKLAHLAYTTDQLLDYLAGANTANNKFDDSLHKAVYDQDELLVRRLLGSKRYNVNAIDPFGETPLMYAVNNRNAELATLLLRHGASPFQPGADGDNAFQRALATNAHDLVTRLKEEITEQLRAIPFGSPSSPSIADGPAAPTQPTPPAGLLDQIRNRTQPLADPGEARRRIQPLPSVSDADGGDPWDPLRSLPLSTEAPTRPAPPAGLLDQIRSRAPSQPVPLSPPHDSRHTQPRPSGPPSLPFGDAVLGSARSRLRPVPSPSSRRPPQPTLSDPLQRILGRRPAISSISNDSDSDSEEWLEADGGYLGSDGYRYYY